MKEDLSLLLDQRFQPRERAVPLLRNLFQRTFRVINRLGLDLEQGLASALFAADQSHRFQYLEMLSNRLPCHGGIDRKMLDRMHSTMT